MTGYLIKEWMSSNQSVHRDVKCNNETGRFDKAESLLINPLNYEV